MAGLMDFVPTVTSDACILWQGRISAQGYGIVSYKGKIWPAHRFMFFKRRRKAFKPYLYCCHKCDTKLCVNVNHLYMGTPLDNQLDRALKGIPVWERPESRSTMSAKYLKSRSILKSQIRGTSHE